MSSDLVIALSGGGAFLQIHAFENGVFSEFILDADNGFLYSAVFLKFLGIHEEIVLMIFLRHHMVARQIDAMDRPFGIHDSFIE